MSTFLLLLLALLGHAFLWIGLVNRLHAVGVRRWIIKDITLVFFACAAIIPVALGWQYVSYVRFGVLASGYIILCWVVAPATLLRLVWLRCFCRLPPIVRFRGRQRVEIDLASVAATPAEIKHHWLARLPLNETLQLELTRWVLDVPRLAPTLDGLSIVHLSDLHLTGRVGKAYFREIVRVSNELQPDLICITGDIVERACCFDWIADTLGRLVARHGVYFVLGNHDLRVDAARVRRTLEQNGLIDLGDCQRQIEINGTPVALAGNEGPWFNTKPRPAVAPRGATTGRGLMIALAHTPDQLAWARSQNVDLLLAGHTHGGQIRIPPLGAIFSPTARGVEYISGVFFTPPTILHVSRGLSGDIPVRWNCPPEIAHLRLRSCSAADIPAA
jgi:uncharacterized protein